MQLKSIFEKPIDRAIEGVIKADDLSALKLEVEEYVITDEVAKRLEAFFSAYTEYRGANGVWISGFFGSGKSHLLKMLSLLLENRVIDGKPVLEYFLPKCRDAMLKADMRRAAEIPSRSILFNIDQKADTITKTETDAVLAVFVKVFNELCGYYGKQGYVAQFERDLDKRGLYEEFKRTYADIAQQPWEMGREEIILEEDNISQAYAQVSGNAGSAARNIMDAYRSDYKLSIEDFAAQVNDYIQKQPKNFRLNFFVDEVGQYIADNVKLMTNLQTLAESLETKCRGRAWLIVTAQEDMNTVLGEMGKQSTNDFSKIQDRFKTRLKLTSQNVDEVIQTRLLKKNAQGETYALDMYEREKNNFGTLFDFTDGATTYRNFKDKSHFIACYPFIPYQFTLFQSSIENLSKHAAFEGRHSSVGERSMLGVFQQVVVEIASQPVGRLAAFDRMFEGIRASLVASVQRAVLNAENNVPDAFAVRVLKALFLVKYIRGFNATPRNLRVLLQETFDQDVVKLRNDIQQALNFLEQQTYIQRNGDVYEYLTDEEKDVEQEIKNTDLDSNDVVKALDDLLFTGVIRESKLRYDVTKQDFSYTRKLDDRNTSPERELAIHFVTPFNGDADNLTVLQSHSLGRPELLIALPPDVRFVSDLQHYKRTEKYVRLNRSSKQSDAVLAILDSKARQNLERYALIQNQLNELIGRATFFVAGTRVEIAGEDPRTRIAKGFAELVVWAYPNLRMLKSAPYAENDIKKYLELAKNSLLSADATSLTEPEQEVLLFVNANKRTGLRTTMKSIEENFSKRPYGWYLAAIQCVVAMLLGRGKLEARSDSNLLEGAELERALRNTHGFPNIIFTPQTDVSASDLNKLKKFYSEFFDRPAAGNEAKALGAETRTAFQEMLADLRELYAQVHQYPFLAGLEAPLHRIQELAGKEYAYYFDELLKRQDELLDAKEDLIAPLRAFMNGPNKTIYDQASSFLQASSANFTALESDTPTQLQAILAAPDCFQGNRMKQAKSLLDSLKKEIEKHVKHEQEQALKRVEHLQSSVRAMDEYAALSPERQSEIDQSFQGITAYIQKQNVIAVIRDGTAQYETREYNALLNKMTGWAHPEETKPIEYISQSDLRVKFDKPYLADADDVDAYLDALKRAMLHAIRANKRIRF